MGENGYIKCPYCEIVDMRNQKQIYSAIDEMVKSMSRDEAHVLIDVLDEIVLQKVLSDALRYICGIKNTDSSYN